MQAKTYIKLFEEWSINEHLQNYNINTFNELVKEVETRFPFLKEYQKSIVPSTGISKVEYQKYKEVENVTQVWNNEPVTLPKVILISNFTVSYQEYNERKWFTFYLENNINPVLPQEYKDDVVFSKVFHNGVNLINSGFKSIKQIIIKSDEEVSEEKVDEIYNHLNGEMFKFDAYIEKNYNVNFI